MKNKYFALFVFGLLMVAVTAFPLIVSASHAWGTYHWSRTANPLVLQVGDNVSASWDAHLVQTVGDWSQSSVIDLQLVAGGAGGRCRPTAGRLEVCNDTYGQNGWLGLAQIWLSGDHISQGTAKMNDTYFALPQYNTADERNHVMCQEVGHLFGLGHTSEDGTSQNTCMDYSQSPTSTRPNQHDYDMIASIYAHLDSGSGGGGCKGRNCANGAGLPDSDMSNPGEWGQLVRSEGRSAIYERDFGNGNRVVTFVVWANR